MVKKFIKICLVVALVVPAFADAQLQNLFRTRDRMDNLEGFDDQKYSWGFYLAGNNFDYKLVLDPIYGMDGNKNAILSESSPSFGAGLIGKARLHEYADLRLEPGLHFVQREITFNTQKNSTALTLTDADRVHTVKSTYIDIPLLLELHGDRWYNTRAYAAAGVNYLVNLQSSQKSTDDNQQGIFRTTTHNFGWSAEAGVQIYFKKFKLTPAFRGTFMTNNELVRDNPETPPYWAAGISTAQTRAFMFVLKFE